MYVFHVKALILKKGLKTKVIEIDTRVVLFLSP